VNHICWWNENAGAIQAICAVAGVLGLAIYCVLTHGIRKSTVAQQKATQAPMLMFFQGKYAWAVKNYGVGPATDVWWKPGIENKKSTDWYELGALAHGDESDLPHHTRPSESHLKTMYPNGARIHYSDMAGNHYATWGEWKDDAFKQNWGEIQLKDRAEFVK
jgi:hypothetical protein